MITDKELIAIEYKKCAKDPIYFITKYVHIQNPNEGGTIKFNLYTYQKNLLYQFKNQRFLSILKSRQLGITTLVAAYCLWITLFYSDQNILFISLKQNVSKDLLVKIKFALDKLPNFLKLPTEERNRLSIRFSNGSQIEAVS